MKQLFINNPRRILLTRSELYKAGHNDLIPGYDCSFMFAVEGVDLAEAKDIKFTVYASPELSRSLGKEIIGSKRKQIETVGFCFRVNWSRQEKDLLAQFVGKQLDFEIEYELNDERQLYGSGVLEVAPIG